MKYVKVKLLTEEGSSLIPGSMKKTRGKTTFDPGFSIIRLKQKHSSLMKCFDAQNGVTV